MAKTALITGITGQDGAYLAQLLLNKGYHVHGIRRPSSNPNLFRLQYLLGRLDDYQDRLHLHTGDLIDSHSIRRVISEIQPQEVYNLAAMSDVKSSFALPDYTFKVNNLGVLNILEGLCEAGLQDRCRVFQASTSELFGNALHGPQSEDTPFHPRNPYGQAKLKAYEHTVRYRRELGLFICNGIMYNHESPLRGEQFVTRKITKGLTRIALGLQDQLHLGNLEVRRDWGHAKDYVEAMWLVLQQDQAQDYVLASGQSTSIGEFLIRTCQEIGFELTLTGEGPEQKGIVSEILDPRVSLEVGKPIVAIDPKYYHGQTDLKLFGNAAKARKELKWHPKYHLQALIQEMVQYDLHLAARETSKKDREQWV
ncbi:MAG: GDP-mannose 4,6-dehydratase [Cyclobacteriaceae bacterium]|nr:GDP-mannose 4,6-dehydratase [Cyclobacteriaceae bacterium]